MGLAAVGKPVASSFTAAGIKVASIAAVRIQVVDSLVAAVDINLELVVVGVVDNHQVVVIALDLGYSCNRN